MPGEEEVTTANRAQRRHPKAIAQIAPAEEPFQPIKIGDITLAESRQLKIRDEIGGVLQAKITDLEKELELTRAQLKIVATEAGYFVTNIASVHGAPFGAQCSIDTETGDIIQIGPAPEPTELPIPGGIADPTVGEPVMDEATQQE